jgi:hypothetical protein
LSNITAYVLISHDVPLLEWCITNARERAGVEHDWLVVNWINDPEEAKPVKKWCKDNGVRYCSFKATEGEGTEWFLENLYSGWNEGYKKAESKWVVRLGSDQFFSQNWLAALMNCRSRWGDRAVYHTWTVESPIAKGSRHDVRDFGSDWQSFDPVQFDQYADHLIHKYGSRLALSTHECGLWYNHPARGQQLRPDGCTWLQTRDLWEEFGPMDDKLNDESVTGDVAYMDRIYDGGVPGFLVPPSSTFHLVRSESRHLQE